MIDWLLKKRKKKKKNLLKLKVAPFPKLQVAASLVVIDP